MKSNKDGRSRVLFILSNLSDGGAQRSSLYLIRYLNREKFDPILFILKDEGVYQDEVPANAAVAYGLDAHQRMRLYFPLLLWRLIKFSRGADLVAACLPMACTYAGVVVSMMRGIPLVTWIRNNMTMEITAQKRVHRWLGRLLYPRVSRFISISEGAADSFRSYYPAQAIDVVYNTLPVQELQQYASMEVHADILCHGEGPLVISVGRLHSQKNFPLLLEAHALLIQQGFQHRLLILGKGEEEQLLRDMVESLGVTATVFMPGFYNNPFSYMRQADLFVLSSDFEGLSRVILEAMAVGVPVVSTDCPSGPRELLQDGYCGLLVPVNDAQALAAAMYRVLSDPTLAAELRCRGQQRANDFGPERVLPQVEKILCDMLTD